MALPPPFQPATPVGAAQHQLVHFSKLLADSLWSVQQLRALGGGGPAALAELAPALAASAGELERLCRAVPDYRAVVGPRDALCARLRAAEARAAALAGELEAAVAAGERAAAGAARGVGAAAEAGWAGALVVGDLEAVREEEARRGAMAE
jgi:hypothetical protein